MDIGIDAKPRTSPAASPDDPETLLVIGYTAIVFERCRYVSEHPKND